jgi:Zn-finger nucleic acid-binding protein
MERATFGARSNVVIDVCPPHGVWFDAGELAQALALAERGVPPEPSGMDRWVVRQEQLLRREASIVAAARASEDPRDHERFGHSAAREEEARAERVANVMWISRLLTAQPRRPGD